MKEFLTLTVICIVAIAALAVIDIFTGCAAFQEPDEYPVKQMACQGICAAAELAGPVCAESHDGWEYIGAVADFHSCTEKCVDNYFTILEHLDVSCLQDATSLVQSKQTQEQRDVCELFEKCFR